MDVQSRRVLILDSDSKTLINLQQMFEDNGVDATITWDEAEAYHFVESLSYDLILIGDHPPELDAAAVLDVLSMRGICPSVLILRAKISEKEVEHFRRLGATGIVPPRDLFAVLEEVKKVFARTPPKAGRKAIGTDELQSFPRAS